MKISINSKKILEKFSSEINIPYKDLYDLIKFESNWNPLAVNKKTGAVGLIQFLDITAKEIGYLKKEDILLDYPVQDEQLKNVVIPYLKKYSPYKSAIDLYMQVFYPAYRNKSPFEKFPEKVTRYNPGIKTPYDYYNLVKKKLNSKIFFSLGVIALWILLKKKS